MAAGRDPELIGGYLASAFDEASATARQALQTARRSRDDLAEKPQEVMVMRALPQPRAAYLLNRGEYDQRGHHEHECIEGE